MSKPERIEKTSSPQLIKADPNSPVLKAVGRDVVVVKAGTEFNGDLFPEDLQVMMPTFLESGADYGVVLGFEGLRLPQAVKLVGELPDLCIGGFHYAPGGNAAARAGGDEIPAINPCSLWDMNFRPACPDPRGMTLVETKGLKFWCDIYLTGANCAVDGTSKFGVTIADGDDRPSDASGKKYKRFDYDTAAAVVAAHGKGLLRLEEFFAAAFGVTEKSARTSDPKITGLDNLRTSRFGLMQATGNIWIWGHDGDPDMPRASILGGSWFYGDHAGSRYAYVGDWAADSNGNLGARGRSDHLQPA